jgi:hypothetical protein
MPTLFGSARRLILTPSLTDVTFAKRGFPGESTAATDRLERVPQSVICGFEWAIDSRDLWFVCGTDPDRVADAVDTFSPDRRADLYSGAGLAATYAGGVDEAELRIFRQRARAYLPDVAQASAFAATARVRADLVIPHTELASRVLCAATPEQASSICVDTMPLASEGEEVPAFELWRTRIADRLTSLQGTST